MRSPRDSRAAGALCLTLVLAWGGCTAEPTKSQYVSARVTEQCSEFRGADLQDCRIKVIKQYIDVSLEEMQATYPKPVPAARPSCSLW